MVFHLSIDSMVRAEEFCAACQKLDCEMTLHNSEGTANPKSMLGILSLMYAEHGDLYVELENATAKQIEAAEEVLRPYLPQEMQSEVD